MPKGLYKSPLFISVVVAVITLIIFSRVLSADFVMWDDDRIVYENPNLTGLSLERLGWIFTHANSTRRYTPLAALTYSITYQLCRLNPLGYHLSPWLFHGLNAALVFFVLRILLIKGLLRRGKANIESWWISCCAAVGALVWSLHPLRTETVAWVGANFYSQALFFMLLSLLCYLWADNADAHSRSHLRRILASAGLFAAALLSHPIVIGFFIVLVALDAYPLGKIRGKWWESVEGRRALLEKVPFVAVGLIITVVTVIIRLNEGKSAPVLPLSQFGLLDRAMQAMYMWAYYIWRPWYPVSLAPVYNTLFSFNPLALPFIASAVSVIGIVVLVFLLRRRCPLALTLAICYLVLLVPVLGIFEHPHYSSDRYSLIVSICFSILLAAFLVNPKTKKSARYIVFFSSIVVIVILGTLSFRQTRIWSNTVSLFEHTLHTLDGDPYCSGIHCRLGDYLRKQGKIALAIEHYTTSLQIKPNYANAFLGLGCALGEQGNTAKAIEYFQKTLQLKPDSAEAHDNLGVALRKQGRLDEAIAQFEQAVRLKPDWADCRNSFAKTLIMKGRLDDAIDQFRAAVRLKPDWYAPMNDLAWYIATHPEIKNRDVNEAIRLATRACELTNYKSPAIVGTLAAAYASAGRFPEAINTAKTALALARAANLPKIENIIQYHLTFYEQGKPYVEPPAKPAAAPEP